ncbi:hypothetical protein BDN70DRAFT_925859 [Pholiota conissans]|uniref:Uncharacterized protein n=1 Tax=Pholiota conissans TaxID=109636 RepID=A0A9P5YQF0_9AGAR|nr:hypothetical protein BDN70DRAFT_925859 [Pholiota conissans]
MLTPYALSMCVLVARGQAAMVLGQGTSSSSSGEGDDSSTPGGSDNPPGVDETLVSKLAEPYWYWYQRLEAVRSKKDPMGNPKSQIHSLHTFANTGKLAACASEKKLGFNRRTQSHILGPIMILWTQEQ